MAPVLLLLVVVLVLAVAGALQLASGREDVRRLQVMTLPAQDLDPQRSALARFERAVARTRRGRALQDTLTSSGVGLGAGRALLLGLAVAVLSGLVLATTLSPLLLPVGLVVAVLAGRAALQRARDRRQEAFIAQMPELARTLSNATQAGLSVRTALALAADELPEPARSELRTVTESLNLGASLEGALVDVERRLPSREVATLVTTLVVSARSGGGVVTALRDIAETLDARKELRRELRTVYAQAVATGYFVLALGVGVLFLLDQIQAGTVDVMLRNPIGQVALVVSGAIYAVGILTIRRMTRISV
jgi:tight adherence protein B